MKFYQLQPNETVIYQCNACGGTEVVLTNLNLVLLKRTKKLLSQDEITVDVYQKDDIKIYNSIPQIKQKNSSVEIYLTNTEIMIDFGSKSDAHKFTNAAIELLTGKTAAVRGAEKVKNAVALIDDTLGIHTMDTVKNVLEKGVVHGPLGLIGNKNGKNGMMATLNNVAQNLLDSNGSETNGEMETLRKLKDLLDAGVITQDEF